MPDIDMDFDERRRGEVIRYATERYGDDRVSQIITFGTIKAKAAIKDSARVLGLPYSVGERITKVVPPPVLGRDMPLSGVFDPAHPRYPEAAGAAPAVSGAKAPTSDGWLTRLAASKGSNGSGACTPPASSCPGAAARRPADPAPRAGRRDHHPVGHGRLRGIGLLKMDLLGLRNLDHLTTRRRGPAQPGSSWCGGRSRSTTSRPTRCCRRCDAIGVFQFDGGPVRALLRVDGPRHVRRHRRGRRALPARPDGRQRAQRIRDRKNGRRRSSRSTRSSPSRSPTSSATPTA